MFLLSFLLLFIVLLWRPQGLFPEAAAYIGLIAWGLLVYFVIATLWHGFATRAEDSIAERTHGLKTRAT